MTDAKPNPPLREVYRALLQTWGPQAWWPATTRFEMILGALLTQHTAWTNVEKAIRRLKAAHALNPKAIMQLSETELAEMIRPSGYFNVKARRIRHFVTWLTERYEGRLDRLFRLDTATLRAELLAVHGIGKETADSILLYAGHRPIFVVDAYTRRFMLRHAWITPDATYDEIAALFERQLSRLPHRKKTAVMNEYHALIVALAKKHCRSKAECEGCPLNKWLP